jgi:hypothetical protein
MQRVYRNALSKSLSGFSDATALGSGEDGLAAVGTSGAGGLETHPPNTSAATTIVALTGHPP